MAPLGPSSPALELAAALRAKELSAVELLDSCLAAVDALNPQINAVIWREDEQARAAAADADRRLAAGDGAPFLGVPLPIKDLTAVAGWPVTYGSNGAPEGVSDESELVVDALVDAGFVLCGRTNTPEFGVITVAENSRYGLTRNPWDTERSPGGSSGGAAAAVAAGMFPIAHANDGGGSIRIPASYCGLVGLKPSRGRVPRLAQSWLGAVVEGVLAQTVADSATVLDAISYQDPLSWYNAPAPLGPFAGETSTPPGTLRIGLMAEAPLGIPTDPACSEAARSTAAILESLGHSVEEVEVPTISEEMVPPFIALTQGGLADYEGVDWSRTEPHIVHQRGLSSETSAYDYVLAARTLELLSRRELVRWGRDFDVLLTPSAPSAAPAPDTTGPAIFNRLWTLMGTPCVNVAGLSDASGMPLGVQIVGRFGRDREALLAARFLEEAIAAKR